MRLFIVNGRCEGSEGIRQVWWVSGVSRQVGTVAALQGFAEHAACGGTCQWASSMLPTHRLVNAGDRSVVRSDDDRGGT